MRQKIEQWYAFDEVIGLSCTLQAQTMVYNVCRIKRVKDAVELLDRKVCADWEELLLYLKAYRSVPIALQLQGKGILIKEMPLTPELAKEQIQAVFPNYNPADYAHSYFPGMQKAWLSLTRLDRVEGLLGNLREEGLQVLRLFIGPFVLENILDQLNGYSGHFSFDGHQITRNMELQRWEDYRYAVEEKARFSTKIQGADIAENYLMAYAAAFSLLMDGFVEALHSEHAALDTQFDDFKQRIRFKKNGLLLLGGFFILLLINTLLYTAYQGKYEAIDYQTKENFSNASEQLQLADKVRQNDSLLLALGWNGGLQKAWLLNQLAASLQGHLGIAWQSLSINPEEARRMGMVMAPQDNRFRIQLLGSCRTLNELEAWLRELRHRQWLEQVEISKFLDQNKPNSSQKDFVLNMRYTYDF